MTDKGAKNYVQNSFTIYEIKKKNEGCYWCHKEKLES